MSLFAKINLWVNALAIQIHGGVLIAGAGSIYTPYLLAFHIVMIPFWLWLVRWERSR